MFRKFLLQSFFCCISLENGCKFIGAFEWVYTLYLSYRYYDMKKVGCIGKLSCSQTYYNIISFVVSVAIVSGILKKSRFYFVPWLIIKAVEYAVFTSMMIYELCSKYPANIKLVLPLTFVIVTIFVFWYSWLCVLSLFFNMHHSKKDRDQENSQTEELI